MHNLKLGVVLKSKPVFSYQERIIFLFLLKRISKFGSYFDMFRSIVSFLMFFKGYLSKINGLVSALSFFIFMRKVLYKYLSGNDKVLSFSPVYDGVNDDTGGLGLSGFHLDLKNLFFRFDIKHKIPGWRANPSVPDCNFLGDVYNRFHSFFHTMVDLIISCSYDAKMLVNLFDRRVLHYRPVFGIYNQYSDNYRLVLWILSFVLEKDESSILQFFSHTNLNRFVVCLFLWIFVHNTLLLNMVARTTLNCFSSLKYKSYFSLIRRKFVRWAHKVYRLIRTLNKISATSFKRSWINKSWKKGFFSHSMSFCVLGLLFSSYCIMHKLNIKRGTGLCNLSPYFSRLKYLNMQFVKKCYRNWLFCFSGLISYVQTISYERTMLLNIYVNDNYVDEQLSYLGLYDKGSVFSLLRNYFLNKTMLCTSQLMAFCTIFDNPNCVNDFSDKVIDIYIDVVLNLFLRFSTMLDNQLYEGTWRADQHFNNFYNPSYSSHLSSVFGAVSGLLYEPHQGSWSDQVFVLKMHGGFFNTLSTYRSTWFGPVFHYVNEKRGFFYDKRYSLSLSLRRNNSFISVLAGGKNIPVINTSAGMLTSSVNGSNWLSDAVRDLDAFKKFSKINAFLNRSNFSLIMLTKLVTKHIKSEILYKNRKIRQQCQTELFSDFWIWDYTSWLKVYGQSLKQQVKNILSFLYYRRVYFSDSYWRHIIAPSGRKTRRFNKFICWRHHEWIFRYSKLFIIKRVLQNIKSNAHSLTGSDFSAKHKRMLVKAYSDFRSNLRSWFFFDNSFLNPYALKIASNSYSGLSSKESTCPSVAKIRVILLNSFSFWSNEFIDTGVPSKSLQLNRDIFIKEDEHFKSNNRLDADLIQAWKERAALLLSNRIVLNSFYGLLFNHAVVKIASHLIPKVRLKSIYYVRFKGLFKYLSFHYSKYLPMAGVVSNYATPYGKPVKSKYHYRRRKRKRMKFF